jgi:hypothetical protein
MMAVIGLHGIELLLRHLLNTSRLYLIKLASHCDVMFALVLNKL